MGHELSDIIIGRMLDDFASGAGLHDVPALENRRLVAELERLVKIVAEQDVRTVLQGSSPNC